MLGSLIDPKPTKKSRKSRLSWAEWIDFVLSESLEAQRLKEARRERKAFLRATSAPAQKNARADESSARSTLISVLRAESDATVAFKQRRAMEKEACWAAKTEASGERQNRHAAEGGFRWGVPSRPKKALAAWERGSPHAWWHDEPLRRKIGRARRGAGAAAENPSARRESSGPGSEKMEALSAPQNSANAETLAVGAGEEFVEQNAMQKALAKSSAAIIRR